MLGMIKSSNPKDTFYLVIDLIAAIFLGVYSYTVLANGTEKTHVYIIAIISALAALGLLANFIWKVIDRE